MTLYLRLYWEFFKTGLFAIGGGMATLPFLKNIGATTGWFSQTDLMNMLAVSESTPGPVGINMATYVGFKTAGFAGGAIATLGLIAPSIIIILIIARMLRRFQSSAIVSQIFSGLRPASAALIMAAGLSVAQIALFQVNTWKVTGNLADLFKVKMMILTAFIWFCYRKWQLHPIIYIAFSAAVGILLEH